MSNKYFWESIQEKLQGEGKKLSGRQLLECMMGKWDKKEKVEEACSAIKEISSIYEADAHAKKFIDSLNEAVCDICGKVLKEDVKPEDDKYVPTITTSEAKKEKEEGEDKEDEEQTDESKKEKEDVDTNAPEKKDDEEQKDESTSAVSRLKELAQARKERLAKRMEETKKADSDEEPVEPVEKDVEEKKEEKKDDEEQQDEAAKPNLAALKSEYDAYVKDVKSTGEKPLDFNTWVKEFGSEISEESGTVADPAKLTWTKKDGKWIAIVRGPSGYIQYELAPKQMKEEITEKKEDVEKKEEKKETDKEEKKEVEKIDEKKEKETDKEEKKEKEEEKDNLQESIINQATHLVV